MKFKIQHMQYLLDFWNME